MSLKSASTAEPADELEPDAELQDCDSTLDVLAKARTGDGEAARVLIERTVGPLRRWARGKLPNYARGANTGRRGAGCRGEGAGASNTSSIAASTACKLPARIGAQPIRDEVRRVTRRGSQELAEVVRDHSYSPLEN